MYPSQLSNCPKCDHPLADVTGITDTVRQLRCVNPLCPPDDSIAMSRGLAQAMLQAFGLDGKYVTGISMHLEVGQPIRLQVRQFMTRGQANALAPLMYEFDLVERKPPTANTEPATAGG